MQFEAFKQLFVWQLFGVGKTWMLFIDWISGVRTGLWTLPGPRTGGQCSRKRVQQLKKCKNERI